MNKDVLKIPGLNIQAPWSELIVSLQKVVETRGYPLPEKFKGKPIAVIETPGRNKSLGKAKIIGVVVFSESFKYENRNQWLKDFDRHVVNQDDPIFKFIENKPKHGWVVECAFRLESPVPPPKKRGIIFASECVIPMQFLPTYKRD
jgi:hypothetical protein